ncbi:MAG: hypothetical protein WAQ98_27725 [Blastocatellia bacterium]
MNSKQDKLSIFWIVLSMAIFIVTELAIGGVVGRFLPNFMSIPLGFMLMGLLHLMGYFVGGLLIGATFPKKRLLEPPLGAVGCVLLLYITTFFVPMSFYQYSLWKVLGASVISFIVTFIGTSLGEKLTSNLSFNKNTNYGKNSEFEKIKAQYELGEGKKQSDGWSYEKEKKKDFTF